MTDNDTNRSFDVPPPMDSSQEHPHHFDADVPQGPKKERGSFSAEMAPNHEATWSGIIEPSAQEATSIRQPTINNVKKLPIDKNFEILRLVVLLGTIVPLTVFGFWPSICEIVYAWWYQLDYGHGFFVIPAVALFLYLRLDDYPGTNYRLTWIGLFPILFCCLMRYVAALQYMATLDQWAIFFWILGIVWFFYGNRVFLWALPSLGFLIFMFQLPWSYEMLMRNHLQGIAANFAAILLQLLGEPAIPITNTIRLSNQELAVEMACSGIRFLISILAIAFGTILVMRRPWWQNILIIAIAPLIALFVNAARIAMTGILLLHFESFVQGLTSEGRQMSMVADEIAGITMTVVAVGMFFAFVWYLGKVFRRVEI